MDTKTAAEALALPILLKLAPVVVPALLTWLTARVDHLFRTRVKNEKARFLYERVENAVTVAVLAVEQTYVKKLTEANADGVLTTQEKDEAKRAAIDEAKRQIGPELWAVFVALIGKGSTIEAERALSAKIEAAVLVQSRDRLVLGGLRDVMAGVGAPADVKIRTGGPRLE